MTAKTRRAMIAAKIASNGEITFGGLAKEFTVSKMTIRRDIGVLEDEGTVRRVVGGAIATNGKSFEPSFESRLAQAAENKWQIAEAAVALLQPNETVILDSGSTVLTVAKAIRGRDLGLMILTPKYFGCDRASE